MKYSLLLFMMNEIFLKQLYLQRDIRTNLKIQL